MYDAQTIQMQGTTPTEIYSPWFPRGGDYGLFTLELAAIGGGGTPTLTVALVEKNSSDPGNGTGISAYSISRTSAGRTTVDFALKTTSPTFAGFEELVRYKFTLEASGSSSGVTTWATFRMLAPVWYDKV